MTRRTSDPLPDHYGTDDWEGVEVTTPAGGGEVVGYRLAAPCEAVHADDCDHPYSPLWICNCPRPKIKASPPAAPSKVVERECSAADIEWEIHDDNDRAPRDFWHARITWRGMSGEWVQWGDLGQYRDPVPEAEKHRVEAELRNDLRTALTAALGKAP